MFAGDYIEATAELVRVGNTSRQIQFEAKKVITSARGGGLSASAADVLGEPLVVCRAVGTCVTPKELQRRPKELYMPALPAGPAPSAPGAIVTPQAACVLSALSGSAIADAAALSALLVPMMVAAGHSK